MRTTSRITRTTRTPRRAQIATAFAATCLAVPMSGLLGGTALADSAGPSANASDRAAAATAKPAGFIGPVAPALTWRGAETTPYTNTGGVTVGANTTSYETVADGKGSTFTGVGGGQPSGDITKPQPLSTADQNNTGANDTSSTNPYASTRDGAPSLNGNGGGQQVGQPCAGCVGKADNKNPPGQAPDATDGNAGYECDRNHGIGRSNPAHTGCVGTTTTGTVFCPGTSTPMPASGVCPTGGGTVFCPGTTTPMPASGVCSTGGGTVFCPGTTTPMPASGVCSTGGGTVFCPGTTTPMPTSGVCSSGTGVTTYCPGTTTLMPASGICAAGSSTGGSQLCPNGSAMPASGDLADCTKPVLCPAGTLMTAGGCTTPAQGGLAAPVTGQSVVSNGTTAQPVLSPLTGNAVAPGQATVVTGGTTAAAETGGATALPFTGSNDAQLAAAGVLMLLLGGGLVVAARPRRRGAHAA